MDERKVRSVVLKAADMYFGDPVNVLARSDELSVMQLYTKYFSYIVKRLYSNAWDKTTSTYIDEVIRSLGLFLAGKEGVDVDHETIRQCLTTIGRLSYTVNGKAMSLPILTQAIDELASIITLRIQLLHINSWLDQCSNEFIVERSKAAFYYGLINLVLKPYLPSWFCFPEGGVDNPGLRTNVKHWLWKRKLKQLMSNNSKGNNNV